jgi:hypothetical protein
MARSFKPSHVVNASNSVLAGVFVNKYGKIKEIRTRVVLTAPHRPPEFVKIGELIRRLHP